MNDQTPARVGRILLTALTLTALPIATVALRDRQFKTIDMMQTLSNGLDQLMSMSPPLLCVAILIAFNLLLRRIPHVPNWVIPVLSAVLGPVLFYFIIPRTAELTIGRIVGIGFIVGTAAGCFYGAIVLFAESKWPWLAAVINGPDSSRNPIESPLEKKPNEPTQPPNENEK